MRILWSSDQHTVHQNTPTNHILKNLATFFYIDNDLANVDMVIFGGDFMHRSVESYNDGLFEIMEWMKEFLLRCEQHNVKVRFLEGTSSHDWGQPRHFTFATPHKADVKYVDTLSIETFPEFDDLTMMYVPDNMGKLSTDTIWDMALETLNKDDLKIVDLIAFHGAFTYQLPPQAQHHCHMQERWESIVKYGIFAGHIHTPSHRGKIYCSGSFDRIAHGEEHPKGGYIIDLDKKKEFFLPRFYENKRAMPYLTVTIDSEETIEQSILRIQHFIKDKQLHQKAFIRVVGGTSDIINPVINILKDEYPQIGFKADNEKSQDIEIDETLFDTNTYQGVSLTKDNLFPALYMEIEQECVNNGFTREEMQELFEEFQ